MKRLLNRKCILMKRKYFESRLTNLGVESLLSRIPKINNHMLLILKTKIEDELKNLKTFDRDVEH
jgi:hypothetical protein